MRGAALALVLMAVPAAAQQADPYALVEGVLPFAEAGDLDGAWRHLDRGLRAARREGPLSPDWGVVLAMLSDSLRNTGSNPAYALLIAEEGLALVRQGGAAYATDAAMLETSRAYALADMGRFDEAAAAALLAAPVLAPVFGEDMAEELRGYAAQWSKGALTALNTSALDLARRSLDAADAALDRRDFLGALTEAARADLPEGTGFAEADLRLLRAEARALMGRALFLAGRVPEAALALDEGAAAILAPGWQAGAAPQWRVAVPQAARGRLTELFYWRGRAAVAAGDERLALAALAIAEGLNDSGDWRVTLMLPQVQVAQRGGEEAAADAVLARAGAAAAARGDGDMALLVDFYRAANQAAMARTWDAVDAPRLIAAARAAAEAGARGDSVIDPDFVLTEAAAGLPAALMPAEVLALARQAAVLAPAVPAATAAARVQARKRAEAHLAAAHALDAARPGAVCPDTPGMGCALFLGAPNSAQVPVP